MVLIANFIGIDRHLDPNIRDLTGAKRDALALWALFTDTIPDIQAKLIVDTEATVEGTRQAFEETLQAAGPEDTVIFSFSGHGTHDNRIVAHNTTVGNLADTAIPMSELAERFKHSKAKSILCILDCCFSGGAPARVLEDSPISRDPSPLQAVAGTGRILITASKIDEPAYEHPATRHGLLTKALLDVFQASVSSINLIECMGQVMERVRAEAARMGVLQSPVLLGHIEGGLVFPPLRPGSCFFAAFPERRGVRVSTAIGDLADFNIPSEILVEWAERFKGGLNDLQLEAINEFRVLDGESLLVVAPTSAGKTFIGEMAATRAIIEGRKAVFLLPYRALVNEKYDQFSQLYGERLGMRVVRCTGDYVDQTVQLLRGKYDLAILTYEMWLNLVVGNPNLLNQIGLVVLDEAQFITDPNRGITVELLLTYLLAAREKDITPQIVALSAVIGDISNFDGWLGCKCLVSNKRPVTLTEGVLDRSGVFQHVSEQGNEELVQLLPAHAIRQRKEKPSAQDVIVPLVQHLVEQGEKVIIFRNQRGSAQGCAAYLATDLGLPAATETIDLLPTHDPSSSSGTLRACLNGGAAFHSANLNRDERTIVERAFRDPKSKVRVLAATTTVAAGINTPASTVILAEQEFMGEDGRPFTVAEYKNMAGRAGRLGYNEEGKAIILADNIYIRDSLFRRYVIGNLEPLRSSFEADQLDTWVVRLLAQVDRVKRQDVVRLLMNTYGGYLANLQHPDWRGDMEQRIEKLLVRMSELECVEEAGDFVQLTLLGRACGRSALSFESAMRLVELLRQVPTSDLSAENLIAILQVLPESDGGYTPMFRRGQAESVRPREAAQRYGSSIVQLLQRRASDQFDYLARCKRAALLYDWIHGVALEEIENRYTANPFQGRVGHGDIRKFADATRLHLHSAHQIASLIFVGAGPDEAAIETILKQLEVGIPADALGLLSIPISLTRGEYLILIRAGVRSPEDFWELTDEQIQQLLGSARMQQTIQIRPVAPVSTSSVQDPGE